MSTSTVRTLVCQLGELQVRVLEAGRQGTPNVLLIHDGSDALKKASIPHMMQWITALLHEQNVEKVFLVGTSVGGLLARFYAAQYPATVERLVLVNGGQIANLPRMVRVLINTPGIADTFYRFMYRRIYSLTALQRAIYHHDLLTEHVVQAARRASIGYMSLFRAMLAEPWPVQRVPVCPTLIVWGQEDRLAHPEEGKKLLHEIPQAEFLPIEQAGHLPMLEQPEIFNAAIAAFLKQ
jgi:pimeloyl-ACP methyl ester carboxylesterase